MQALLNLIFQIDPITDLFIPNAFGARVDYVVLASGTGVGYVFEDIDDITISPVTGRMYAVSNIGGTYDQLLEINKSTGVISIV